jgi:hypothetical protein
VTSVGAGVYHPPRMSKIDLFALARANEQVLSNRREEHRSFLSGEHLARFDRFCAKVEAEGGISVNMKPWKLRAFLERGRYLSAYQDAEVRAHASGRSVDDEHRERQQAHYERRALFEGTFEDGERFLYGALNIGGVGAVEYGLFCVFLDSAAASPFRCAYVPDNSLERYVKPAPVLVVDEATSARSASRGAKAAGWPIWCSMT